MFSCSVARMCTIQRRSWSVKLARVLGSIMVESPFSRGSVARVYTKTGRFLAHPVAPVLLPALTRSRSHAWRVSPVDTPAPPLYTCPDVPCDRLSVTQLQETPMQCWPLGLCVTLVL